MYKKEGRDSSREAVKIMKRREGDHRGIIRQEKGRGAVMALDSCFDNFWF